MNILNKSYFFTFYSIIFLVLLIVCFQTKKTSANSTTKIETNNVDNKFENKADKNYHLIIFIHGTILPRPSILSFQNALESKEKSNFYQKYLNELRITAPYVHQPIGEKGLHKIDFNIQNSTYKTTNPVLKKYLELYQKENVEPNTHTILYTFGWDGELSHKNRIQSSDMLYESLNSELTNINKENTNFKINIKTTILAHSHGGNVALNLAKAEDHFKKNIKINELLLFGTPIQEETKNLVTSNIFENIYNFYSTGDTIQIADIISTAGSSERRLNNYKNFPRIVDIEVKLKKEKPRHSEFWFSKDCWLYRKDLILSPFPIVVFAETMKQLIENAKTKKTLPGKRLQIEFRQKNKNLKIYLRTQKDNLKICSKKFENYF